MVEADEDALVVDEEMPAGDVEEVLGVDVMAFTVEEIDDVVTGEEMGRGGSASSAV